MESILPDGTNSNVEIKVIDINGDVVDIYNVHNRLVLRYHLVITHLLSPVGNASLQSELSTADFTKYGVPTDLDLKVSRMKFGTDDTTTDITMSGIVAPVEPLYYEDGTTIDPTDEVDYYTIDTYKFSNGSAVNGVPDYDQAITFETTMAGPQGNGLTTDPVIYKEAGLYTLNEIMIARTNLPSLNKTEDFSFRLSWTIRLP